MADKETVKNAYMSLFPAQMKERADEIIETIDIISSGSKHLEELKDGVKFGMLMANSQNFARTLTMEPAQFITPTKFANIAQELAKSSESIECKVYSKPEIEKMKMNAFLAVGKGSIEEPKLVHLKYTCKKPRKKIALIGKGITFDYYKTPCRTGAFSGSVPLPLRRTGPPPARSWPTR